ERRLYRRRGGTAVARRSRRDHGFATTALVPGWGEGVRRTSQLFQPLLLVEVPQGLDERVELAGHDLVEVEVLFSRAFAAEAVVGAAVLGEVVGSDALRAVAGAHHRFAAGGEVGVLLGALGFVE